MPLQAQVPMVQRIPLRRSPARKKWQALQQLPQPSFSLQWKHDLKVKGQQTSATSLLSLPDENRDLYSVLLLLEQEDQQQSCY